LKLDKAAISVESSFFELGGNSLRLVFLANKLKQVFKAELPLAQLIQLENISNLAKGIQDAEPTAFKEIEPASQKPYYALSSVQHRLHFLYEFDKTSLAYNMPQVVVLEGEIDKKRVETIFRELIARHEALRTAIINLDENPVQKIENEVTFSIDYLEGNEANAKTIIDAFIRPFDLSKAPLLRVGLIKQTKQSHLLMVDIHHIISDGISQGILIRDFMALYSQQQLSPIKLHYKDYTEWQQRPEQRERFATQRRFWQKEFEEEVHVLDLPSDYSRPLVKSYRGSNKSFLLTQENTKQLKALGEKVGGTLFVTVFAAFNVLLSKLTNRQDITIGTSVAGRDHADLEKIIGMFVNTLAIRNKVDHQISFQAFLENVKTKSLACFDNQSYPYEELVSQLNLPRDTSRNPLFDVMLIFQNFEQQELNIPGLTLKPYGNVHHVAMFDLTLMAMELNDELHFSFEYATDLFKEETIERFISLFKKIILEVVAAPDKKLEQINILPEDEYQKVLYVFNETQKEYPKDKTIVDLFERQVTINPDKCALFDNDESITYAELDRRINALACFFQETNVKQNSVVGLLTTRSIDFVTAAFAVLKAGGLYMPMDASYPSERINYMLRDSNAVLLLTTAEILKQKDIEASCDIVCHDVLKPSLHRFTNASLRREVSENIYVIYTSGSTGVPKGVIGTQAGLLNRLHWGWETYPVHADEVFCLKTNIGFVDHVVEIFSPLLAGVAVRVFSDAEMLDVVNMYALLRQEKVTRITLVPTYLNALLEQNDHMQSGHRLRYIFSSGEDLPFQLADKFYQTFEGTQLVNIYGSTEVSADVTYFNVERDYIKKTINDNRKRIIPIGKPIANTRVVIVDGNNVIQPIGISGELCVMGEALSQGYINHPELTEEKFISGTSAGERLYKTGDLARWLPDGNIEYLGRMDGQVKVRGFRIELGEIERHFQEHPQITNAVAMLREKDGNAELIGYYVAEDQLPASSLRSFLTAYLPEYMVPAYFVQLNTFPLTSSGKVNRKLLPEPDFRGKENYVAPLNETEKMMAKIWGDVLSLDEETISVNANFFELGGHSIRAVQLINKMYRAFTVKIPLRTIFEKNTIATLALVVERGKPASKVSIPRVDPAPYHLTSPAQKRMYYGYLLDPLSINRNINAAVELGVGVDIPRLKKAFQFLITRHAALRTCFALTEQGVLQRVLPTVNFVMESLICQDREKLDDLFNDFIQPFDLANAPLMRGAVVSGPEKTYLFIDIHHIVCDGTSVNILLRDLRDIYFQRSLPQLELEYVDFAAWVRNGTDDADVHRNYWSKKLADVGKRLNLPVVQNPEFVQKHSYSTMLLELDENVYGKVKSFSNENGVSEFMFFLSVFYIMLHKITGDHDIIVGSDVQGRNGTHLEGVVGTFVNILPLRMIINEKHSYVEFLRELKECVLEAYEHQDYPYDRMLSLVDSDMKKLVDVHFAFANTIESTNELEELQFQGIHLNQHQTSEYEFQVEVHAYKNRVLLAFIYDRALYDEDTLNVFVALTRDIVNTVLHNKAIAVNKIDAEAVLSSSGNEPSIDSI
jgi:gramicidin S synthase 2/tyrocidine synthetase-3